MKVYLASLARYHNLEIKINDDKTKIHGVILLQLSNLVKVRLRRTTEGTAAEKGNCPRELIKCLQVALCTTNHNDPLESMKVSKAMLVQMHHAGSRESLGDMVNRVSSQVRTVTSAVEIFIVSEYDRLGLVELPADTVAERASKQAQREPWQPTLA
jgi:hypothetical protein